MSGIINIASGENLTDFIAEYIFNSSKKTAVICGGRRPFLFINKKLAAKSKRSFYPPDFFTNDAFVDNLLFQNTECFKIPDIESAFILYGIIKREVPELLKGNKTFAEYLQWLFEILSFIDRLDMENISEDILENIKKNAEIGYDVPKDINTLLQNLLSIRHSFHRQLDEINAVSKGFSYLKASQYSAESLKGGYEEIILLSPFYLYKSEIEFFKKLFDCGVLTIILVGEPHLYEPLKKIYSIFGAEFPKKTDDFDSKKDIDFEVLSSFDNQTQCLLAKNILKDFSKESLEKTLIIIPNSDFFQPAVLEISQLNCPYNISLGYPISKTAVFSLIKSVFDAQLSKRGKFYYLKDITKVLKNPLVKSAGFLQDLPLVKDVFASIERFFLEDSSEGVSKKLFIEIDGILGGIAKNLDGEFENSACGRIKEMQADILKTFFGGWEKFETLSDFAEILISFIDKVFKSNSGIRYHLNADAAQLFLDAAQELKFGNVSKHKMAQEEILNIFTDIISAKRIALSGTPLQGLQILGFLEARNLSFDNVLILGMSDADFPSAAKISPLIPQDVSFILGSEFEKRELEIQKYYFDCIVKSAKKVYLIYADNEKEARSRFIEELIWEKQKKTGSLNSVSERSLSICAPPPNKNSKRKYAKTPQIAAMLRNMRYSHSAFASYLSCRLKFYFSYVLGLAEAEEIGEEAGGKEIGNFIHEYLQNILKKDFDSQNLKKETFINESMSYFSRYFDETFAFRMREDAFMAKAVLEHRLKKFWLNESYRDFKKVFGCEQAYSSELKTELGIFKLKCKIDRIDELENGCAVIDYKTGAIPQFRQKHFQKMKDAWLFTRKEIKKATDSYQLPLYKYIFENSQDGENAGDKKVLFCGFYDMRKAELKDFFENTENREEDCAVCIEALKKTLEEINSGDYFEFDSDDFIACGNCPFAYICR